jgi:hypothetical protein
LLSLNLADAIIVPERLMQEIVSASRLELQVLRPPQALLGRAALSYLGGSPVPVIQAGIRRLSNAAKEALGIQSWEAQK